MNSTTPVHRLHLVPQLSLIHFSGIAIPDTTYGHMWRCGLILFAIGSKARLTFLDSFDKSPLVFSQEALLQTFMFSYTEALLSIKTGYRLFRCGEVMFILGTLSPLRILQAVSYVPGHAFHSTSYPLQKSAPSV